ncbi:rod shape-determining protein MreD [Candidatus Enterococcus leclercqii]|uniref:rod shape-determining protein MreD n=1 Tax=Candidatus Enterococcus leclercqii TaxID=1857218 RepID=UPI00137B5186|nr:rod shape-determining protein MreD [Enterococcus sp. CU9D]KAF1293724.1 rod shape-determining protein MreD [Enterococcus sp. CU9D]
MAEKNYLRLYGAPVLFLLMLLDTQITRLFDTATQHVYLANAHLFLIGLMVCCMTLSKRYMMITGVVLGVLFDCYYIGAIGIYTVAMPFVIWLMYLLSKVLYRNIFTMFFGTIILVTAYELVVVLIQQLFNLTNISMNFFVARFLGPTLLLNLLLFILFIYPFKKIFAAK